LVTFNSNYFDINEIDCPIAAKKGAVIFMRKKCKFATSRSDFFFFFSDLASSSSSPP